MTDQLDQLKASLADHYAIEREIGSGGMATVYVAEDLKHHRKVAVKVLRPELAAVIGAERFLKEIEVTANLQHPHILQLYDSGSADGFLFYVMPYVEGESLRDKLNREKQLSVDESVEIAKGVASALDYAHRHDVIHRDIKPENILLHEGQAVVADFGVALAVSAAAGKRLTETGLSVGTPHYMSPEQASADRELDGRTDVYSLGATLYEMLVGEPPFTGASAQAIVAKILTEEPTSVTKERHSVPPHVEAALLTSLAKLPADRFSTASEFADALGNPAYATVTVAGAKAATRERVIWSPLTLTLSALVVVLAGAALWGWTRETPREVSRFSVALPQDSGLEMSFGPSVALSPDGSQIVYVGPDGEGGRALWVKESDQLSPRRLPGTDGAYQPFFAPDGRRVGFYGSDPRTPRKIQVMSLSGEPPLTLLDSGLLRGGGSWGPDGYIYAKSSGRGLIRMPEGGGPPEPVTIQVDGENHSWPNVLPNGRGILFTVMPTSQYQYADATIAVHDLTTGEHRVLLSGAFPRFAESGHIVFVRSDGMLMAVPFDQGKMELNGEVVPLVSGFLIGASGIFGGADLALSASGTLVYVAGQMAESFRRPVWVDRAGSVAPIDPEWTGSFAEPALSPDGSRLAVSIGDGDSRHIWIKTIPSGPASKLTFEGRRNNRPMWSSDGQMVSFISWREADRILYRKRADGIGAPEIVLDRESVVWEGLWSPDRAWLVFREGTEGYENIYALNLGLDTVPTPLVVTGAAERAIALSPGGAWLAYVSDESGRDEVYVRPFPGIGDHTKWQVSREGGQEPQWGHSGNELFYRSLGEELVAVAVETEPTFAVIGHQVLFPTQNFLRAANYHAFSVATDDQRFVFVETEQSTVTEPQLILVQNFFEELKEKVGSGND